MGWTTDNKTEPQGDFGQGSVNNSFGFGSGAINNLFSWGIGHAMTLGHAITNLVGGGAMPFLESLDFSLTDWGQLPETGVVYTANEIEFTAANQGYIALNSLITLPSNNWFVTFVIGKTIAQNQPIVSNISANDAWIQVRASGAIRIRNNNAEITGSYITSINKIYKLESTVTDYNLYENGVLVETFGNGGTGGFNIDLIGVLNKIATPIYSSGNIRYLNINNEYEYKFREGEGLTVSDSVGGNDGTLTFDIGALPTWITGVDTPISLGTQTALVTPPLLSFTGQNLHHVDLTAITPNNPEWTGSGVVGILTRNDALGDTDVYCFKMATNEVSQLILSDGTYLGFTNVSGILEATYNGVTATTSVTPLTDDWVCVIDSKITGSRDIYIGSDTVAPISDLIGVSTQIAATQGMILGNNNTASGASLNGELVNYLHYTKSMTLEEAVEIWTAVKSNMK